MFSGVENWGGQCTLGRRQSPIDLVEEASVVGHYPSLMFENYDQYIKNATVRNTGHSRKYYNNIIVYLLQINLILT